MQFQLVVSLQYEYHHCIQGRSLSRRTSIHLQSRMQLNHSIDLDQVLGRYYTSPCRIPHTQQRQRRRIYHHLLHCSVLACIDMNCRSLCLYLCTQYRGPDRFSRVYILHHIDYFLRTLPLHMRSSRYCDYYTLCLDHLVLSIFLLQGTLEYQFQSNAQ